MISSNIAGPAAYAAIQTSFTNGTDGADAAPAQDSQSFGAALQGAITNLTETGHAADAMSNAAMMGKGNLTDVVMAVSKAEMALQTSVAVRDRVISAYQDIMRMAV